MKKMGFSAAFLLSSVVLLLLVHRATSLQWSATPTDGQVLYACEGGTLSIAWSYSLDQGESVSSTVWNFQSSRSQEMVAMSAQGNFFPMPSFAQRVTFLPDAGIALSHVTSGDAGNYSVTVTGLDASGSSFVHRRNVVVKMTEGLPTTDHMLHADQMTGAQLDNTTGQWHSVLTCGNFTPASSTPPVSVEWTTPDGQTLPSSGYSQGQFTLLVPNPVKGGNYTCRIASSSSSASCSSGGGDDEMQAIVPVDAVLTRLSLLEAGQQSSPGSVSGGSGDIQKQIQNLVSQQTSLKTEFNAKLMALTLQKDAEIQALRSSVTSLREEVAVMKGEVANVSETCQQSSETTAIAFTARLSARLHVTSFKTLVFGDVIVNVGGAYNNVTGLFTAPLAGVYFFTAMTSPWENSHHADISLHTNDSSYGYSLFGSHAYSDDNYHTQTGSLQGSVHLQKGQQVWVAPLYDDSYYQHQGRTVFSGFLVSKD